MVYGLGVRTLRQGMQLARDGVPIPFWNRDWGPTYLEQNSYGSHPFALIVSPSKLTQHHLSACFHECDKDSNV